MMYKSELPDEITMSFNVNDVLRVCPQLNIDQAKGVLTMSRGRIKLAAEKSFRVQADITFMFDEGDLTDDY